MKRDRLKHALFFAILLACFLAASELDWRDSGNAHAPCSERCAGSQAVETGRPGSAQLRALAIDVPPNPYKHSHTPRTGSINAWRKLDGIGESWDWPEKEVSEK